MTKKRLSWGHPVRALTVLSALLSAATLLLPSPSAHAQRGVGGGGGGTGTGSGGGLPLPPPAPTPPAQTTGWWFHKEGLGSRGAGHNLYPTPMPVPNNWTESGQASEAFNTLAFDGHGADEGTSANTSGTITLICTWMGNAQDMPEKLNVLLESTARVKVGHINPGYPTLSTTLPSGYSVTASNGLGDAFGPLTSDQWGASGKHIKTYATSGAAADANGRLSLRIPLSVSANGSYGPINTTDTSFLEASAIAEAKEDARSVKLLRSSKDRYEVGSDGSWTTYGDTIFGYSRDYQTSTSHHVEQTIIASPYPQGGVGGWAYHTGSTDGIQFSYYGDTHQWTYGGPANVEQELIDSLKLGIP